MLYDQNAAENKEDFLKFWEESIDWSYFCNKVIDTDVTRQMIAKEKKILDELEKVISQVESKNKGVKMSEEKKIDFCELRNLVYEISDLNESAIAVLENVNVMEANKVVTVLKCNEEKMNLLLEKLEDLGV